MSATCELLRGKFQPLWERIRAGSQPCDRWCEAHDPVNGRAPSDLCMCPFCSGQVINRCACSGSSCLNPFYDMFITPLWKGEILENLTVKHSGAKKKMSCEIYFIGVLLISNLVLQS